MGAVIAIREPTIFLVKQILERSCPSLLKAVH
jgi:hypothetical protein